MSCDLSMPLCLPACSATELSSLTATRIRSLLHDFAQLDPEAKPKARASKAQLVELLESLLHTSPSRTALRSRVVAEMTGRPLVSPKPACEEILFVSAVKTDKTADTHRYYVELASKQADPWGVPVSTAMLDVSVLEPSREAITALLSARGWLDNHTLMNYWVPSDGAEF